MSSINITHTHTHTNTHTHTHTHTHIYSSCADQALYLSENNLEPSILKLGPFNKAHLPKNLHLYQSAHRSSVPFNVANSSCFSPCMNKCNLMHCQGNENKTCNPQVFNVAPNPCLHASCLLYSCSNTIRSSNE